MGPVYTGVMPQRSTRTHIGRLKKNKMSLNIGFRVFGCPFRRTAVRISTNARVQILNIRNNDQINISTPVDQVRQDRSIVRATGVQSTE